MKAFWVCLYTTPEPLVQRCSKPLTKECLNMVDTSVEKIVEMFARDYTPAKVCAALRMCQKPTVRDQVFSNDISRFDPPTPQVNHEPPYYFKFSNLCCSSIEFILNCHFSWTAALLALFVSWA